MTGVHRAASKHKNGVSRAQRSTKVMRCRPGTVPITAKQAPVTVPENRQFVARPQRAYIMYHDGH